jgi:zinc transporter, ZIP family
MLRAALFAVIASSALPLGAWIAFWRPPSRAVTAALLAFASGALITTVAFELFEDAFRQDAWRAGVAFAAGAVLASLADTLMPRAYEEGGPWVAARRRASSSSPTATPTT